MGLGLQPSEVAHETDALAVASAAVANDSPYGEKTASVPIKIVGLSLAN